VRRAHRNQGTNPRSSLTGKIDKKANRAYIDRVKSGKVPGLRAIRTGGFTIIEAAPRKGIRTKGGTYH
jgi:hypothetical protein